jgi:hypothetical protein
LALTLSQREEISRGIVSGVDLHLKLTQDLHLILTRPDRPIMA